MSEGKEGTKEGKTERTERHKATEASRQGLTATEVQAATKARSLLQ
jgi:hypothetical protein